MMQERDFFVDIHCHPNLKVFSSGYPYPVANLWDNVRNAVDYPKTLISTLITKATKNIYRDSQSNLYNLTKGNVKVVFASIFPIEKGFLQYRKFIRLLVGNRKINVICESIFGININRIYHIQQKRAGYFRLLNEKYQYLKIQQGASPCNKYQYRLVSNFDEIEQITKHEPNTIAIVLSIEGAHSLGCGNLATENVSIEILKKKLTENIGKIKAWEFPPFFINLAHHFWNQLCGHARSLKHPINIILNQKKGLNIGITELGEHVIHSLLSTENGKRILIDIKHMSVKARKEYYRMLSRYKRDHNINIPIICSHTGVNGFKTMDDSVRRRDSHRKSKNSYLHKWSINLSDEEIRIIHRSNGMIGIIMDKGVIGGGGVKKIIKTLENDRQKKDEYIKLILTNVFHIVDVGGTGSAWDIINIGSDFDGSIQHIDTYESAEKFNDLYEDLVGYLKRTGFRKELWYEYSPVELVSKVMRENAIGFLKKNFN